MAESNVTKEDPSSIPGPDKKPNPVKTQFPEGSCDCHAHLFGPQKTYPYDPHRRYTPADCSFEDYSTMLTKIGISRAVLVQPSVYMTDNRLILDTLATSKFYLRAVVVTNDDISDRELENMHQLGVRGIRLNLRHSAGVSGDIAPQLAQKIKKFGWHLQFRINPEEFLSVGPMIESLPVDTVIDHMGQIPTEESIDSPSFKALINLLKSGRCWIKMSAPYRMGKKEFPYDDVYPFANELVNANPDRIVWASDWPHTTLNKAMPNDGDLANLFLDWVTDENIRKKILVDNPSKLYGF
jgi:predicted TIM-barrel fold metal-dependent hydrolase